MVEIFWLWPKKGSASLMELKNNEMDDQNRGFFSSNRMASAMLTPLRNAQLHLYGQNLIVCLAISLVSPLNSTSAPNMLVQVWMVYYSSIIHSCRFTNQDQCPSVLAIRCRSMAPDLQVLCTMLRIWMDSIPPQPTEIRSVLTILIEVQKEILSIISLSPIPLIRYVLSMVWICGRILHESDVTTMTITLLLVLRPITAILQSVFYSGIWFLVSKTCHLPIHRNNFWSLLQHYLRPRDISISLRQRGMKCIPFRTNKGTKAHLANWILLPLSTTPRAYQTLFPCIHMWIPFVSLIRLICLLPLPMLPRQDIVIMHRSFIQFIIGNPTQVPRLPTLQCMLRSLRWSLH